MPRLHSLRVENFRSIAGRWEVPLDAEVVLVHGANGAGKTSLLSALELGATGNVRFLSEGDELDHALILNRSYPLGAVQLRVEDASGSMRAGSFEFDRSSLRGAPALDPLERSFFAERVFLAQTQLGRFLETYTVSSKQADSALVRFVKSLVGLEELDSLIDGLYNAGHVSRTRNASERWTLASQRVGVLQGERIALRSQLNSAQTDAKQASDLLRELLAKKGAPEDPTILAAEALRLEGVDGEEELPLLEGVRARLEGVQESRTVTDGSLATSSKMTTVAARAADDFAAWERSDAPDVLSIVNETRNRLFGLPPVTTPRLFEAFDDLRDRVGEARAAQHAATSRNEELSQQRAGLESQIAEMSARVQDSALEIAAIELPSDAQLLIEALAAVLPVIHDDSCPICEQPYPGGADALTNHVQATLARLSSNASGLLTAETHNRALRKQLAQLEASRTLLTAPEPPIEGDFVPTLQTLNQLEKTVESGRALLQVVQTTQAKLADIAARRAADDAASRSLSSIRDSLGLKPSELSIDDEIMHLKSIVEQRLIDAQFRSASALRVREIAQLVIDESGRVRAAERDLVAVENQLRAVEASVKEAEARKDAANELKKKTERIRSDVISRVFDATLNGLWADLFKRLAPAEPFVPRFRKHQEVSRFVDVRLETVLQDGGVGGAPGEMLSFGNSNTAAISLFMALHLSAPSKVPWLIFDDPVQSMDDIHVANFATVVRQLAYSHRRQVVVAVHQRELFDYLSLELAPATNHQSLIKVEVERAGGATRIDWDRIEHRPEVELLFA